MHQQPPNVAKASLGKCNTLQKQSCSFSVPQAPFPLEAKAVLTHLGSFPRDLGQAAWQRGDPSLTHNKTVGNILGICLQPHKDFMQCI